MGKRKKKNKNQGIGNEGPMKRIVLSVPVPDDRPNWPDYERHEVMMSVTMEYAPPTLLDEYLAVICPVAKRRIAVSYLGWTCSYNKLLNMDRKFQSALPGGNVRSIQVVKSNDMCVLDCLHLKAERTFYILDLMHWKQLPYYQAEAEFRFHWIRQVENEMDLRSCHPENEYMFKSLPRFACREDILYEALEDAPFKVDGMLFFHKSGFYTPGSTVNVLWLPPEHIETVLGWKPPDKIMQGRKKPTDTPKPAATKSSGDAASAKASASTANTSETATGDAASAKASAATANTSETATGDAASAKASAATANTSETATGDAASAKASAATANTSETATTASAENSAAAVSSSS
ncbi:hypothetical protein V1264_001807 [Littorina saxatilis]|uniref:Snurportin-1 n=2 Tax=Littorina saxatilis TaxID=31220 RepID=A0AAN9C369_9CAEN